MKAKRVDGLILEQMLRNGLANIILHEQEVNKINVFPVPDGDTGSNMRLTLENGIKYAKPNSDAGLYLKDLARGMLYGSRGNSGVILSQIFAGFAKELERDSIIDAGEFIEGFEAGVRKAYDAVTNPKEGTLLTVSREGISNVTGVGRGTYIDVFFEIYLNEIEKSLNNTPNILPILKESNVVDSGGLGYFYIIQGIFKFLNDEDLTKAHTLEKSLVEKTNYSGYEVNIILNITSKVSFKENECEGFLNRIGRDVIFSVDDDLINIHLILEDIKELMDYVLKFGAIVKCDINSIGYAKPSNLNLIASEHVSLGKIIVSNGIGLNKIYEELGASLIIDGGKTMNTSCEEIVEAIKMIDADNYVIITNNKNINMAAYQAIDVLKMDNIKIIESENFLEGYFALASDDPSSNNINFRINEMKQAIKAIKTISFFQASKDSIISDIIIKEGYYTSLYSGMIIESDSNLLDTIYKSLNKIVNISEYNNCIILKGINYTLDDNDVINRISNRFPNLEITFMYGGQLVHNVIIGLI